MQDKKSQWVKVFSSRLKEALKGKKQKEIAKELDIGQSNISMYCSDKDPHIPTLGIFRALCISTGVKSDWLLGLDDTPATGISVHASGSAAVAAASPGAKVAASAVSSSEATSRLLSIIESQQRVIENLSKPKK